MIRLLLLVFIVGCVAEERTPVEVNVFHKKSSWGFQDPFKKVVQDLGSKKVYVKFFDVVYAEEKGGAWPFAELRRSGEQLAGQFEVVPTVDFENKVFEDDSTDYHLLSQLLLPKMNRMAKSFGLTFREMQIDCDWTEKTKGNFFTFCKGLKKDNDSLKLTAAIRPHQVKSFDILGIPPVDQGVLVFHKKGRWENPNASRVILNWEKVKSDLENLKEYPLTLSLSLPAFSLGVHYNETGTKGFIQDLTYRQMETDFIELVEDGLFRVKEDRNYLNRTFATGDYIKLSSIDVKQLEQVWEEIKDRRQFNEVIIYHLHGSNFVDGEASVLYEMFL